MIHHRPFFGCWYRWGLESTASCCRRRHCRRCCCCCHRYQTFFRFCADRVGQPRRIVWCSRIVVWLQRCQGRRRNKVARRCPGLAVAALFLPSLAAILPYYLLFQRPQRRRNLLRSSLMRNQLPQTIGSTTAAAAAAGATAAVID